ncbi:MAG: hypothetical protein OXB84_06015 [Halobacteriovoraceae bacterium]|nr:hypothetical protein [Halobacteriovoraceae bacterium]
MNKIFKLYRNIDEFLFKQIDRFKNSNYFQKYIDEISKLEEHHQRKINQALIFLLLCSPILMVLFLFLGNYSIKSELATKRDIIDLVNDIQSNKAKLSSLGRNLISQYKIKSMQDLQNRLQVILENMQINLENMQVDNFKSFSPISGISQTQADLEFKNFSMNELVDFLTELMTENKAKISSIDIKKHKNTLSGKIHIIQYEKTTKQGK